jgi:hypothetical protein
MGFFPLCSSMSVSLLRSQVCCGDGTLVHHLGFGQCFFFFFEEILGGEFSLTTKNNNSEEEYSVENSLLF